jgi:hypothetical protein
VEGAAREAIEIYKAKFFEEQKNNRRKYKGEKQMCNQKNVPFWIENLLTEIKKLTNEATVSYHTKPKAKIYVSQLKCLESKIPKNPKLKQIFYKLVNHVDVASGQIKNKQHWLYFVEQDLVSLEHELKNNCEGDNEANL